MTEISHKDLNLCTFPHMTIKITEKGTGLYQTDTAGFQNIPKSMVKQCFPMKIGWFFRLLWVLRNV